MPISSEHLFSDSDINQYRYMQPLGLKAEDTFYCVQCCALCHNDSTLLSLSLQNFISKLSWETKTLRYHVFIIGNKTNSDAYRYNIIMLISILSDLPTCDTYQHLQYVQIWTYSHAYPKAWLILTTIKGWLHPLILTACWVTQLFLF